MWRKTPILRGLYTLLLFLSLQAASFLMIAKDSIFQQVKISGVLMFFKSGVSSLSSDIQYYFALKKVNNILLEENRVLKNELELLKSRVGLFDDIVQPEYIDPHFTLIPAKVISNSTNKLHNYIIIDRGRRDGIKEDMGVITSNGVVGVVSSVSEKFSYIISFLNVNQSVSARISPSGAFGPLIWEGRSTDYATLIEIPYHIEFSVGDTITTSGFSRLYPEGIPLGTIKNASVSTGSHHRFQVQLFQDFSTLRYVYVAINNNYNELNELIGRDGIKK